MVRAALPIWELTLQPRRQLRAAGRRLAGSRHMIDDFAKAYLHSDLRELREAILWKLDGLGEYDVRRPLTATGTNLLGLVKHLSVWDHMLTETSRHAGHADILREQLDGLIGTGAWEAGRQRDAAFWATRRAAIERAAKAASPTNVQGWCAWSGDRRW